MKHGAVRKLTRAAALSFLVLATTSSVAGLEVLTASSAMADPSSQGDGSNPSANGQDPSQNPGTGTGGGNNGGGLLGGIGGSNSSLLH
ncbi:MAG: hypothetical protein ABIZ05_15915 [Pseudonocardiaceae bacterium]